MALLVNTYNWKYSDNENSHLLRQDNFQFPAKINMSGFFGNEVIGQLFMNENLTRDLFLQVLEDQPLIYYSVIRNTSCGTGKLVLAPSFSRMELYLFIQ